MDFSSANSSLWSFIINLGVLSVLLLFGNILRRKVGLVGRSLLPTSVIAGFVGLALRQTGILTMDALFLDGMTYHTIAIGFIALGLRVPRMVDMRAKSGSLRDGTRTGMLIVSNYLLQGVLGLVIMIVLSATFMPGLFRAGGLLLPMGFGQGPGQANNIGSTYEMVHGFTGGQTFGLAIATFGFLWASIGGIIYLNYLVRRGRFKLSSAMGGPAAAHEPVEDEGEIPLVEAIDKFTIQIALVLSVYLLTYVISYGIVSLFDIIPGLSGAKQTIAPLIWGFNFLIGSSLALSLRGVFARLRKVGLMTRQYPNNYLLNRISGFAFDFMIVASITSIEIGDLKGLWVPFLIMTTLGGAMTLFYNIKMAKRLYPSYEIEGMISMYGMMTGTISTAILLLREVDPGFKTPAANNLVVGSSAAIVMAFPILIMVGLAPQSTAMLYLTLALAAAYALVLNFLMLRKPRKGNAHPAGDS